MRHRSLAAQHDAAVARRLELLNSELAAVREQSPGPDAAEGPVESWRPQVSSHIRVVPDLPGGPELDEHDELDELDELVEVEVVDAGAAEEPGPPPPSVVRLPGRHASRRSASWGELVPEGLRGRVLLGPAQVAVVAVLVAVGLAVTCWWLLRSGAHEQAAPPLTLATPQAALASPDGSGDAADPATGAPAALGSASGKVVVDVTGRVRHPGIAVLRQGSRVVDAVRAAGGARPGVDLGGLNLARVLTDGEQVVVGQTPVASVAAEPGVVASAGASPGGALVDINTADETTLESLPEVGPVTAAAIIAWRTQHGGFTAVSQLLDVDGIGDATLAKLTPYVTI